MGRGKRRHTRVAAHVILGLAEGASLDDAAHAHLELSRRYQPDSDSGNPTMFNAVQDAYAVLKERAAAAKRGELIAGLAVVDVLASMRELSDYLLAGDEESVTFARRRDGMPPWVSVARRHTAVVAPVV